MKVANFAIFVALSTSACEGAEPPQQPNKEVDVAGAANMKQLAVHDELLLTTLAASAPKALSGADLCSNVGICGDEQKVAIDELVRLGLVNGTSAEGYRLTEEGRRYIATHFDEVRDGDSVSFETPKSEES